MEWVHYALIAAIAWGIGNVIDKLVVKTTGVSIQVMLIFTGILGVATLSLIVPLYGLQSISFNFFLIFLIIGLLYQALLFFYFKVIQIWDLGNCVPFFIGFTPILTLILGVIFLNDQISFPNLLGISLVTIGAFLISLKPNTKFIKKAIFLSMMVALTNAIMIISLDAMTSHLSYWDVFSWVRIGALMVSIVITIHYLSKNKLRDLSVDLKKLVIPLGIGESTALLGQLAIIIGLSTGFAPLVVGVSASQTLFAFLFVMIKGRYVPRMKKENKTIKIIMKIISCILISFGVYLIAL